MEKLKSFIRLVQVRYRYLSNCEPAQNPKTKVAIQAIASLFFLVLSIANVFTKSPILFVTLFGFFVNALFPAIALKTKNVKYCTYSSIIMCTMIFSYFVITGANDGFASLWIAILPLFAMAIMDFWVGLIASVYIQIFLMIVFWTPAKAILLYPYNTEFCLRFPLLFFTSMTMSLVMTLSLQQSQYEAQIHLEELEKVNDLANQLARSDPLTGLANRRRVYEVFASDFSDETQPHTIVMCDIDYFKQLNDSYGHEFGDEVLITIARTLIDQLPANYVKSRWGGEEFLIAANEPIDSVYEKIEELRLHIANHGFTYAGKEIKLTLTFGLAEYYRNKDLNTAINTADSRMYVGKNTGRNRSIKA